jgi:hypothetical protein
VVVLSQEFVRKEHPMTELQMFLDRRAEDPSSIVIVPVLFGLTVEECYDPMASLYNKRWPQDVAEPGEHDKPKLFVQWTAAVKQLTDINILREDEVGIALARSGAIRAPRA